MPNDNNPILNPVLVFKRDPRRNPVTGRSLTEEQVRSERLPRQRAVLSEQVAHLRQADQIAHSGHLLIAVRMFDDSYSPTYQPDSIFQPRLGSQLVAPVKNGYLAQVDVNYLNKIQELLTEGQQVAVRVAISRIEKISPISIDKILGGREAGALWQSAVDMDGGKVFSIWFAPYIDGGSRNSVVTNLKNLQDQNVFSAVNNLVAVTREPGSDADQLQLQESSASNSFSRAIRDYRQSPFTRAQVLVANPESLSRLIASGSVFKVEPVRPLIAAELPSAPDPERPVLNEPWQPIVGIVDGGLFAASYDRMTAWRAPSLVSDVEANRLHGNRVSSLVIQGNAWNSHLDLPALVCRVGVAQAIAKHGHGAASRIAFRSYLKEVVARHHGDTKVWNFSFNEPVNSFDPLEMSELGHEIHKISREFNILPVISIGNVDAGNSVRLNPPADCEAALTVGGRLSDSRGPGLACPECLVGPGPEGLTKPELSWFSTLRGIGGSVDTGSSYATALTSAVAAHAFHNLKSPTPDLVRALLINTADRDSYDSRLGWGSPFKDNILPWVCREGSVTLVWTSQVRAGEWYYWEDIPIPPEFIYNGKLKGRAALTAVLQPLVSELGSANYFSTRLQVALQYMKKSGGMGNLAGSMRVEADVEIREYAEQAKWNPIRHHLVDIKNGMSFSGQTLRVCARVFGRDLYQHGFHSNAEVPSSSVAFALTLSGHDQNEAGSSIYNSVASKLGAYVESAVNDVEINVSI